MNPQRVLITGATGFVGCRLAEMLSGREVQVVGMVRSWHKAARLARLPVKMVYGDLSNPTSLREAMRGCDTVLHCALDSAVEETAHQRAMVEGTRNIMEAACDENVKKIVYLSSTAVYGFWPPATSVTEETPTPYTDEPYSNGKIDSEKVALKLHRERGLPVTILRPSMVYGPFETFWAAHLIRCLGQNWMTLINGGTGICNSLYIDNLVAAIWRAAQTDATVGQVFIISDAEKVTWKQMIEGHAAAVKNCRLPLPDATVEEIAAARRAGEKSRNPSSLRAAVRLLRRPETREALRTVPVIVTAAKVARGVLHRVPEGVRQMVNRAGSTGTTTNSASASTSLTPTKPPVIPLSDHDVRFFTCDVVFSSEKARKLLDYRSEIDFAEGIRRTAEWIKWMKL